MGTKVKENIYYTYTDMEVIFTPTLFGKHFYNLSYMNIDENTGLQRLKIYNENSYKKRLNVLAQLNHINVSEFIKLFKNNDYILKDTFSKNAFASIYEELKDETKKFIINYFKSHSNDILKESNKYQMNILKHNFSIDKFNYYCDLFECQPVPFIERTLRENDKPLTKKEVIEQCSSFKDLTLVKEPIIIPNNIYYYYKLLNSLVCYIGKNYRRNRVFDFEKLYKDTKTEKFLV